MSALEISQPFKLMQIKQINNKEYSSSLTSQQSITVISQYFECIISLQRNPHRDFISVMSITYSWMAMQKCIQTIENSLLGLHRAIGPNAFRLGLDIVSLMSFSYLQMLKKRDKTLCHFYNPSMIQSSATIFKTLRIARKAPLKDSLASNQS